MQVIMRIKIILVLISVAAFLFFAGPCSVVFTSSITGSIVDRAGYDEENSSSGIAETEVFLYTDEDLWNNDYNAWTTDNSSVPDFPANSDEPFYFLKTISDNNGDYSFNGLIWNELFPKYGKTGDRKEVFLLFFHEKYGLNKNPYSVFVVSDVTNRLPLFKFDKILNTAEIAGSVVNSETGEAIQNVNVRIWIPETWNYSDDGSIDTDETSSPKFTWNDSPSYTAVTDVNGEWRRQIAYKMLPTPDNNMKTTIVRFTYEVNGYLAEKAADSEITDGGWDKDGNGVIDADEQGNYFQPGEISADTYSETGEIALSNEFNSADITGRIINSSTNEGEANVSVDIFVAEDWSYTDADPDNIVPPDGVTWPEFPSYTTTTNAAGEYNQAINFDRKPSETDNRKTTRVRLVFSKGSFLISNSTDGKLTDNPQIGGNWDRDGNGTVDADEDDSYHDPEKVIHSDSVNDLGSIVIKQTEFRETISGEVWDSTGTTLVNGAVVWLFYNPIDQDTDPLTPMETPLPAGGDTRDYIDMTSWIIVAQDQKENGHFSFPGLEWEDEAYTAKQSQVSYYIHLPSADERASGVLGAVMQASDERWLTAGATNYVSLQHAP